MEGINAHAVTVPYSAEEPVRFSRYSGRANRIAALPNREII
jgi:transketolase